MTTCDWIMAFGLLVVIGLVLKGLWGSNKIKPSERPNTHPGDYDNHWNS